MSKKLKKLEKLRKELADFETTINNKTKDYIPKDSQGNRIHPDIIRSEILEYLKESGISKHRFFTRLGILSKSYRKFMDENGYRDRWLAVNNRTYIVSAKFFEKYKIEKQIKEQEEIERLQAVNTVVLGKRPFSVKESGNYDDPISSVPLTPSEIKKILNDITKVDVPINCPVYANCDEIRSMIHNYLTNNGILQHVFLDAIGSCKGSYHNFKNLSGKGVGANQRIYQKAWRFFEQKRIYEGKPMSARHLEQIKRWGPSGFELRNDDGQRWVTPGEYEQFDYRIYDIEWCKDQANSRVDVI